MSALIRNIRGQKLLSSSQSIGDTLTENRRFVVMLGHLV